ncbi:MAG: hypothetical protein HRU09_11630 [Oligoflexales bacterium]|nr:hypothetical protein [Oligoflexales bacterium]
MFNIGPNSLPKPSAKNITAIKNQVSSLLELDEQTTVFVTQLECKEPGCPPIETVIALIKAGEKTQQKKIHKAINEVTKGDIEALFSAGND